MNKNNILTIGAAALAILSCANPVMAAEPTTKSVDLKYQVDEVYEWGIHPEINFGKNAGINQEVAKNGNAVSVTKNVLHEGAKLQIVVRGSGAGNAFTINNGGNEILSYAVNKGTSALTPNAVVLEVPAGTNQGSQALDFKLTTTNKKAEVAGTYNGTVTYTASIVG